MNDSEAKSLGRITVSGNEFRVNGSRIWINGANTPWKKWNEFGGDFDFEWWDNHFKELHENGVNATRVWITCNGEVGVLIREDGTILGATDKHWVDVDSLFDIALRHRIYIMATLISFDHFKTHHENYNSWRKMIQSTETIDSYVENYLMPFLNRYKDNPALWSIDLCNEPDWVHQNPECGYMPWEDLNNFFARCAAAIHKNSSVLVTVGMGIVKNYEKVNDATLKAAYNDPAAYLDFYSPHYYPWMDKHFGIPFYMTPEEYKIDSSKPIVIGECPATASTNHTLVEDYENAFLNGYQGVMPWTSSGIDRCGSFEDMREAVNTFRRNHPELILP